MSPFLWQGRSLCGLSLVFVKDWRVVYVVSLPAKSVDKVSDNTKDNGLFGQFQNGLLVFLKSLQANAKLFCA